MKKTLKPRFLVISLVALAAFAVYLPALRLKPHYARAHFNLGEAYLARGRTGDARREFEAALRLKPDYAKAREALGSIMSQ